MSVWRRKALELFPRYAAEIQDPANSIYQLFFDLLPDLRGAVADRDIVEATKIADFAAWAFDQKELSNAAAVAFYEHLFDQSWGDRREIAGLVPARIATEVMVLWKDRLAAEQMAEVRRLFASGGARR